MEVSLGNDMTVGKSLSRLDLSIRHSNDILPCKRENKPVLEGPKEQSWKLIDDWTHSHIRPFIRVVDRIDCLPEASLILDAF
jgi:hypothetical protein